MYFLFMGTRPIIHWYFFGLILAGLNFGYLSAQSASKQRIVSLGGSVTETIFALGSGPKVVAVDISSLYPTAVHSLPQVGYFRTLSAEGVLSLNPDLILASEGSGPPTTIEQLRNSGVEFISIPDGFGPDVALQKIRMISSILNLTEEGKKLENQVKEQLERVERLRKLVQTPPRVAFIWGNGNTGVRLAGSATGADLMLELAGAINAAASLTGYQPMSAEAVIVAEPEFYIIPESTVTGIGGIDELMKLPGIGDTPAGLNSRIIVVDLLAFIGFGPRVGEALLNLMSHLHPEITNDEVFN
tara:strand:+ start:846 stop:1748 length:903 start_codon:yes stop_codon:yes gene_type:complete